MPERARAVLDFWFGEDGDAERERHRQIWFRGTAEFDDAVRRNFLADHEKAASGALAAWEAAPSSALALVLLLDQVPRNIFRESPRAYATDPLARAAADRALRVGFDQQVPAVWRTFFYLPFEHSESLADQHRAVTLFAAIPHDPERPEAMRQVWRHLRTIERFGRFPHRNAILGRPSAPDEIAFLAAPDPDFYCPPTRNQDLKFNS